MRLPLPEADLQRRSMSVFGLTMKAARESLVGRQEDLGSIVANHEIMLGSRPADGNEDAG